jgi:hypothetical protein
MAGIPQILGQKQQDGLTQMVKNFATSYVDQWNIRTQLELADKRYMREVDQSSINSRARQANDAGDPTKMQNITMPIVMPQVEIATSYFIQTFLSGYPMFSVVSSPENIDLALQFDTIIAEQSIFAGWHQQFAMFFRDGFKYNLHALDVDWIKKKIYQPITDVQFDTKIGKPQEVWWEGNEIKRLDLYNSIWDKRVHPSKIHTDGEFAGYTDLMTRIQLKMLFQNLDSTFTMNAKVAFEQGSAPSMTAGAADQQRYYTPQINPDALLKYNPKASTDWMAWSLNSANNSIRYQNVYEVTKLYARIIPSDFLMNVPARNQVQIWKFYFVNWQVLIYAERMTNAHDYLPIIFGQPIEDGLQYQTKSFGNNVAQIQDLASSLWNSVLASRRRTVYDRIFYDPSRINANDINNTNPIARIPIRSMGYGKPVSDAYSVSPYRDEATAEAIQAAQMVAEMGDWINGTNKVQRGQFQKGNKTLHEYSDTMEHSNSRLHPMALFSEGQVMTPVKYILKTNILQYQPTGELYNRDKGKVIKIDPTALRQAVLEFQIADGLLPVDRIINSEMLQLFIQTISTNQMLAMDFDVVGAFTYWAKTQGARWLDSFKRSPEAKQALLDQYASMQQAKGQEKVPAEQVKAESQREIT